MTNHIPQITPPMSTHSDNAYQDTLTTKFWTSGKSCICPHSKADALWRRPALVTNIWLWPSFCLRRRDEIADVPVRPFAGKPEFIGVDFHFREFLRMSIRPV